MYERTSTAYTPGNEPGLVNDIVQGTRKGYEGGRRAVNDETYVSEFEVFWSLLHTNLVDLVFSDINMPDITSLDVARLLPPGTLFIFTSAYAEHTVSDERQTPRPPQPTYRDDLLAKFRYVPRPLVGDAQSAFIDKMRTGRPRLKAVLHKP